MKQCIGIVDYGHTGNIYNIQKAIKAVAADARVRLIQKNRDIADIDKIILPGVGAYRDAMRGIASIKDALVRAIGKKPTLGICLGMQILAEKGYEFGETPGLGVVEGEVMRLAVAARIPHLGWARVERVRPSRLFADIGAAEPFYFMHSYELINYKDGVALVTYHQHHFIAAIEKENVFGVQFHPEKSGKAGLRVFKNFLEV